MEKNKIQNILLTGYANVCRFLLAVVFVFSGFVKANDPLGFFYKLGDYSVAFNLTEWLSDSMLMFATLALATLEFTLGVYLFFGINRRLASSLVVLLMGVMTPLTLYLALKNPISDCGCFGDAIVLTNWQTFWKNVVLLIASVSVLFLRNRLFRVVTRRSEWLISFNTLLYVVVLSYYCLSHLPVFDFRPYHISSNIPANMEIPEGAKMPVYETVFVMEKNGVEQEFSLENYPDSSWTFVDRRTIVKEPGYEPPIHDFALQRVEDGEDITEQVLSDEGYTFLLVAHRIETADDGYSDLVNELYDYSRKYGYAFYGLTASTEETVEQWLDRTGGEYPFCNVDEITLKTMVRSNPGLILIKNGVVLNKWANEDIPDEYQLTASLEEIPLGQVHVKKAGSKIIICIMWFIIPLLLISLFDRLFFHRKPKMLEETKEEDNNTINPLIK